LNGLQRLPTFSDAMCAFTKPDFNSL